VYDAYWRFAHTRQEIFWKRVRAETPPWSDDPVLARHRFTNVYRAADRVSQYLIRHVIYEGPQLEEEVVFRTLLFKLFNRIETWEALVAAVGLPRWSTFSLNRFTDTLDKTFAAGARLYSAAYIMPSPNLGHARKHRNHLALLDHMMRAGAAREIANAKSLESVFRTLRGYPSLGPFLAFQFAIDLNYSEIINFDERDFVVAGPGARNGIKKCFSGTAGLDDADVIRVVTERAEFEFARQQLPFNTLWGRPLQLIDCQNLFCEIDKYSRVTFPDARGVSQRTRIKQRFAPKPQPLHQWYPPKWNLVVSLEQKAPAVAS